MNFFRNVVFLAAIAGLCAGLAMSAMQIFGTAPLILQAETFENAAAEAPAAHSHDAADSTEAAAGHHHGADAWEPREGFERNAYTVLANLVTGIGFALVLVAFSEFFGGIGNWRQGLLWGFAGFATFALAPGLGLPPELPAMPAADLVARQIWWIATVAGTAIGLAMVVFGRSPWLAVAGLAFIVAPHLIGAPQPDDWSSPVPEGLHHQFVVVVTITNLVFWSVLGLVAGALRTRLSADLPAGQPLAA